MPFGFGKRSNRHKAPAAPEPESRSEPDQSEHGKPVQSKGKRRATSRSTACSKPAKSSDKMPLISNPSLLQTSFTLESQSRSELNGSTSMPSAVRPSPLLRLPVDIRLMIYELVDDSSACRVYWPRRFRSGFHSSLRRFLGMCVSATLSASSSTRRRYRPCCHWRHCPHEYWMEIINAKSPFSPLLWTCSTIRNELHELGVFRQNDFDFCLYGASSAFYSKKPQKVPRLMAETAENIQFILSPELYAEDGFADWLNKLVEHNNFKMLQRLCLTVFVEGGGPLMWPRRSRAKSDPSLLPALVHVPLYIESDEHDRKRVVIDEGDPDFSSLMDAACGDDSAEDDAAEQNP